MMFDWLIDALERRLAQRVSADGPLRRAVAAVGGAFNVKIDNYHNEATVNARRSDGPDGQVSIDVLIEPLERAMASRMARGQGPLGKVIEGAFGGKPPVGR